MDRPDPAAPPDASSLKTLIRRTLSAVAIYALGILLTRYRLGPDAWQATLTHLSTLQLILLIAGLPLALLISEFSFACFDELITSARKGGQTTAALLGQLPTFLLRAARRTADLATLFAHHRLFERRYRRRVVEHYALFNDRGLGLINAARLDLEEVYVELQISSRVSHAGRELLGKPVAGRKPIWTFLSLMRSGRGLVVLGAPGSGKTTLLQHLLLVFASRAQKRFKQPALLPIFVELRNLAPAFQKDAAPTLTSAIRSYWARESRTSDLMSKEPKGWLDRRLRSGRVLLLIDGLDEVPQSLRATLSAWIQSQMRSESYRQCRFLLASRPGGYEAAPLEEATALELQPFNDDQVVAFIERWYLANELTTSGERKITPSIRRHAVDQSADLRERLRRNYDLQELSANPLLLTMICMVHRYRGALPGTRSQLYGEICQVLLERWRQAKGINDDLSLTGEQKIAVLRPLAREFMIREARELREQDIRDCVRQQLKYTGYLRDDDPEAVSRFLRSMQANSGLLLEKEAGLWGFAHKTFQEYLVADYWLRQPDAAPEWQTIVTSEWWREACLLYAARADVSELVAAALSVRTPTSWSLAFQCLTEAHGMRPEVRELAEKTLRTALRSAQPPVFAPAARALQHLRQLQIKPLTERLEQRATMVSQAEYQLFLDLQAQPERTALRPPHWNTDRFSGDPETPILGVWPWQAQIYTTFLTRTASPGWRLPTPNDPPNPHDALSYWTRSGELVHAHTHPSNRPPVHLPRGLKPDGLTLESHDLMTFSHSIAEALWIATRSPPSQALALAASLQLAIAITFSHEVDTAWNKARDVGFNRPLLNELIGALDTDIRGKSPLKISGGWRRLEFTFGIPKEGPPRPPEYLDGSRRNPRQELLIGLQQLIEGEGETRISTSARVWRRYGACVLRIPLRRFATARRDELLRIGQLLDILVKRDAGQLQPHEGIQLVRDITRQ